VTVISHVQVKTETVYRLFDEMAEKHDELVVAYSGGKDSTLLLLLLYKWLARGDVGQRFKITILHNDTLGEINPMEFWARSFMAEISERIRKLGHMVETIITTPPARDTFYWRVIVRGYPAPNYYFRWCVKLKPTGKSLKEISCNDGSSGDTKGLART